LVDILKNNRGGQLALARALGEEPWPAPEFEGPLIELLKGRESARATAAAAALAQYKDDGQVLGQLIATSGTTQPDDVRVAAIQAIGTFDRKTAAQALIRLQEGFENERIQLAVGDALMAMTGLYDLSHDEQRWQQWWSKNSSLSDRDFAAALNANRGQAFERELARKSQLENVATKLLGDQYRQARAEDRSAILLRYLRAGAPEVRVLGANLTFESLSTRDGAPPGAMTAVRALLEDPSDEVRAAAAEALYSDADSTSQMVARLRVETDSVVREELMHSLGPVESREAIELMIKFVSEDPSNAVRAHAAEGLEKGADLLGKDPSLKRSAIAALITALEASASPELHELRAKIVMALAAMREPAEGQLFLNLSRPQDETVDVRVAALQGLGDVLPNLPNAPMVAGTLVDALDDDHEEIRRAAADALASMAQPTAIPALLARMANDPDPSIRAEVWRTLQAWLPSLDAADLASLADGLKQTDHSKELAVRLALVNRLAADAQKAQQDHDAAGQRQKLQDRAEQEQDAGSLLMQSGQPSQADVHFASALDFWKNNNGKPSVIADLSVSRTEALLKASRWKDAASFASDIIRQYDTNPDMGPVAEKVGAEFIVEANRLLASNDPNSYTDAAAFFDAVKAMNPGLKGTQPNDLEDIRQRILAKQKGQGQGG
jgi:HEAT repeat protein